MQKYFILLMILIFIPVSFSAETNIKRIGKYVAVFDLETKGDLDKNISHPLSESIRLEVVKAGRYEVIDRGNMDKILGEQKFQMSGCVSGGCIVEAGQILGVGKIITGSVSLVGRTYYFSLSIINVETGRTEKAVEDKCRCEKDELINASKRLVKKLFGEKVEETEELSINPAVKDPVTGMEFISVKGGCYAMGDIFGDGQDNEKPVHKVCVDDFYIGKYEVTQGQWKSIMGNNPSSFEGCGDNCPVEQVSWNDVQYFIKKLNQKTGKKYRLPTEAEWEYAARSGGKEEKWAGTNSRFDIKDYAWYADGFGSSTHPVGRKKPNWLGLYDMTGNIDEWVADWYAPYDLNALIKNPSGPKIGKYKVIRGGRCTSGPKHIRTTYRSLNTETGINTTTGFRLAVSSW